MVKLLTVCGSVASAQNSLKEANVTSVLNLSSMKLLSMLKHDVRENLLNVLVQRTPDLLKVFEQVSLTEIEQNRISQSQANTPRKCDGELNLSYMFTPELNQDWTEQSVHDQ